MQKMLHCYLVLKGRIAKPGQQAYMVLLTTRSEGGLNLFSTATEWETIIGFLALWQLQNRSM